MRDLPIERVREIAEWFDPTYADDPICNDSHGITEGEVTALARRVLALEEELGEANAVLAKGNDGFVRQVQQFADWKANGDALIAKLTAQRDAAVAIAREAVDEVARCRIAFPPKDSRYQRCVELSSALRSRLATLTGEG